MTKSSNDRDYSFRLPLSTSKKAILSHGPSVFARASLVEEVKRAASRGQFCLLPSVEKSLAAMRFNGEPANLTCDELKSTLESVSPGCVTALEALEGGWGLTFRCIHHRLSVRLCIRLEISVSKFNALVIEDVRMDPAFDFPIDF